MKSKVLIIILILGIAVASSAVHAEEKTTSVDRSQEDVSEVWVDFLEDPESTDNASLGDIETQSDSYVYGTAIPELFDSGNQSAVFIGHKIEDENHVDGEVYTNVLSSVGFGNGSRTAATDPPEIESAVGEAPLASDLEGELENIDDNLDQADYNPDNYPSLAFRTEQPKTTVLLYESGKAFVSGAESPQEVDQAFKEVSSSLDDLGYDIDENPDMTLLEIVGSAQVDEDIYEYITDLDSDKVDSTPTESPWAVYYSEGVTGETTLLLFENGEVAITGAEIPDDLPASRDELLNDIGNSVNTEVNWSFDAPSSVQVGDSIEVDLQLTNNGETGVDIAEIHEEIAFINGTEVSDRNKIGPIEVEADGNVTETVEIEAPDEEASTLLSLERDGSVIETQVVDVVEAPSTGIVVECPEQDINCEDNPPGPGIGPNATVEWYEGGSEVATASTNSSGFFEIPDELEANAVYDVEIKIGGETRNSLSGVVFDPDNVIYTAYATEPSIDEETASPDGESTYDGPVTLSVEVTSNDFPSDEVTVEFYELIDGTPENDTLVGTDTMTESATATAGMQADPGLNEWYAVAGDQYAYTEPELTDPFIFETEVSVPEIDSGSASPHETVVTEDTTTLSVTVDHAVDGEDIDVTFYQFEEGDPDEDPVLGTDSIDSGGTASTTWNFDENEDSHQWYVVAEDTEGFESTGGAWFFFTEPGVPQLLDDTAEPHDEEIDAETATVSIDVAHDDADESIDVTFYELEEGEPEEDPVIGSDTVSDGGTAQTSWSLSDDQSVYEWYAYAEDSEGDADLSSGFYFTRTGEIRFIDEETDSLVDDRQIRLDIDEGGAEYIDDGILNLSEIEAPVNLRVRAEDYYERQISVPSTAVRDDIQMLRCPDYDGNTAGDPTNTCDPDEDDDVVTVRFVLQDRTGLFDVSETTLSVRSPEDDTSDRKTVHSETFGSVNRVDAILQHRERYQLRVENEDGDTRSLGGFTATQSETVELEIGTLSWEFEESDPYRWDASMEEYDGDLEGGEIEIQFEDPDQMTEDFELEVREKEGATVYTETARTLGEYSTTVPVSNTSKEYVVEWTATRDGSEISGTETVGALDLDLKSPFGERWTILLSSVAILVLAGLFGGVLSGIGSVIVAGFAVVLALTGWFPVPMPILALAVVVSLLFYMGERA